METLGTPLTTAIASTAIALILFYTGLRKLRHPYASALAAVNFRVLKKVRRSTGTALGAYEVALGLLLLLPWTTRSAAIAATLTLLGFAALVSVSLARGQAFSCGCFSDDEPISRWTFYRALALAALSAAAVFLPPPDALTWTLGATITCGCLGAVLLSSIRRLNASSADWLSNNLDWEWILQEHQNRETVL